MIQTLTILHILSMFIAFGLTTGAGIVLAGVAASDNVGAIRAATKIVSPLQIAGGIVLVLGLIFGIALAAIAGFGLTALWLIIAYVIAALLVGIGLGIHQPWTRRLAAAAAASPDQEASSQLRTVAADRIVRIAGPLSGLLWIAIIADMVLKPA